MPLSTLRSIYFHLPMDDKAFSLYKITPNKQLEKLRATGRAIQGFANAPSSSYFGHDLRSSLPIPVAKKNSTHTTEAKTISRVLLFKNQTIKIANESIPRQYRYHIIKYTR